MPVQEISRRGSKWACGHFVVDLFQLSCEISLVPYVLWVCPHGVVDVCVVYSPRVLGSGSCNYLVVPRDSLLRRVSVIF